MIYNEMHLMDSDKLQMKKYLFPINNYFTFPLFNLIKHKENKEKYNSD